jgi:hypothetical protein
VSDKEIAKLLNAKGEIMIGGEVIHYTDITSYDKLKELGIAPKDESQWVALKSMEQEGALSNNIETRNTVLGEIKCNDRKLWIECTYYLLDGHNSVLVEVCFRKKGFLGAWYNYSSTTYLDLTFYEPAPIGDTWYGGPQNGVSSHNIRHKQYNKPYDYNASGRVRFQGFGAQCGSAWYSFTIHKAG